MFLLEFSLGGLTQVAGTSKGQEIIGKRFARALFRDVKKETFAELEKKEQAQKSGSSQGNTQDENIFVSIFNGIKNNILEGDIYAVIFGGLWLGSHKFLGSGEGNEEGFFDKWLGRIFGIGAIGSFLAGHIGKLVGLDIKFAMGNDYGKYVLRQAQLDCGKPILEKLDKNTLEKEGKGFEEELYFGRHQSQIMERHLGTGKIGVCLLGPYGCGKTAAIRHISYQSFKRMEEGGEYTPLIFRLNVDGLSEYQINQKKQQSENARTTAAFGFGIPQADLTLMALETLVDSCQTEIDSVKKYNNNKGSEEKEQKQLIIIDEFDKIVDLELLRGCDEARAKMLFERLSNMYNEGNMIIASNVDIDAMEKVLVEIIGAVPAGKFCSRLRERHIDFFKVKVNSSEEQKANAFRIARHLLSKYPIELLKELGVTFTNDKVENEKQLAAKVLEEVTSRPGTNLLTGRHLGQNIADLNIEIAGEIKQAVCKCDESTVAEIKKEKDTIKAAKLAKVSITWDMVRERMRHAQHSSLDDLKIHETIVQTDSKVNNIMKEYLTKLLGLQDEQIKTALKELKEQNGEDFKTIDILTLLYDKVPSGSSQVEAFKSKQFKDGVIVDGADCGHVIRVSYPKGAEPVVRIQFGEGNETAGWTLEDATQPMDVQTLELMLESNMASLCDLKDKSDTNWLTKIFGEHFKGEKGGKLLGQILSGILEHAFKPAS